MAEVNTAEKVKKAKDSRFKQQKLRAWQPILTATTVLPLMFAIGISFIPLGIAFLIVSNNVQEKIIDYTNCKSTTSNESCSKILDSTCYCNIQFTLDTTFQAPVLLYYGLTNYYQNHRRYVKSRDDNQLLGSSSSVSSDCKPYDSFNNMSKTMAFAPCGVIANSLFNDSITLIYMESDRKEEVPLLRKGIAWTIDVDVKYKNPSDFINSTFIGNTFSNSIHPPNWKKNVWELDTTSQSNNGYKNEDLMVWMRTAALPNFRKLYRRVNHVDKFRDNLPAGNYSLNIVYNYPVIQFSGTKRIILTTTSFLGGKNPFLGIAYIVVGCVSVVIGFIFLFIHLRNGKRSKDQRTLPLNSRTPYYDSSLNDHQIN